MRIKFSTKLFMGFLVIIFLNISFIIIVSKLSDLNAISSILKSENEIKNQLIHTLNLHKRQKRSRFVFQKIGKEESADNFTKTGKDVLKSINNINDEFDYVLNVDSLIFQREEYSPQVQAIKSAFNDKIKNTDHLYNSLFEDYRRLKESQKNLTADKRQYFSRMFDSTETELLEGISEVDSLIGEQTEKRIVEIKTRIDNVNRLTLVIVLGISIFSIVFAFLLSIMTTNSLRRLREAADTIGKGEFEFNPSGYPKDEIGDLAQAFFDMAHDLKKAQAELVKSKRLAAIGQIVASVNHEINNPLMIISGNAQFLEMIMKDAPDNVKERIRAIVEETDRISQVTRKLRDIKKPVAEDYTSDGEKMININKSTDQE